MRKHISAYDLVYMSPPVDPMQGLLLGNGDVGAIIWTEQSKILIQINKSDLFEEAGNQEGEIKSGTEEDFNTLRHGCRLIIDFGIPINDFFYLDDFKGRLDIEKAEAGFYAKTPMGDYSFKAMILKKTGDLIINVEGRMAEKVRHSVILERWGSRTFSRWYRRVKFKTTYGLSGTHASVSKNSIIISQQLNNRTFFCGACINKKSGIGHLDLSISSSHCAVAEFDSKAFSYDMIFKITAPHESADREFFISALQSESKSDIDRNISEHRKSWKELWSKSYVDISEDYLENLWYLTMYYANASQGAKYPGRFIDGLWGHNRDVKPWNHYFHWNQQEVYWPLLAAGHHRLVKAYLLFRLSHITEAEKSAQKLFGIKKAIFVSDICDFKGLNSISEKNNRTPVAQIAHEFWNYYQYSGDIEFLKITYDYMIKACCFVESWFCMGKDGFYHTTEATAYEGRIMLSDNTTELSSARALFEDIIKVSAVLGIKSKEIERYKEILRKMVPYHTERAPEGLIEKGRIKTGFFAGDKVASDEVIVAGINKDGIKEPGRRFENKSLKFYDGIFPNVEFSGVFPSGDVGLGNKNNEVYKKFVTTATLYAPDCMGWDPLPIVLARLGLSSQLWKIIKHWPDRWQCYANGTGHYGPEHIMRKEQFDYWYINKVFNVDNRDEKVEIPAWPFRHMGMEPMSVFATAVNESLLQSYDGILRLLPAVGEDMNCHFKLHAAGGFEVECIAKNGAISIARITSRLGGILRIANPSGRKFIIYFNGAKLNETADELIEIETQKGGRYLFVPCNNGRIKESALDEIKCIRNESFKVYSAQAILGTKPYRPVNKGEFA